MALAYILIAVLGAAVVVLAVYVRQISVHLAIYSQTQCNLNNKIIRQVSAQSYNIAHLFHISDYVYGAPPHQSERIH